uniref:Transmembrane protein 120B n=1 Tax=Gopherus evgoodei TaxID=1825980 RepID=A0A8C4WGD8_9SAUR
MGLLGVFVPPPPPPPPLSDCLLLTGFIPLKIHFVKRDLCFHHPHRCKRTSSPEESDLIQQINAQIKDRQNIFFDMEAYLPKRNGYVFINLLNVKNINVFTLFCHPRFAYKDEYEKFKLYLTIILLLGAVACRFILHYRVTDEVFNFLLVWYYCTLTIRESILISNGSRIKGWWVSHHYVSTFLSGVMLTWPDGLMYQMFRNQFLAFSIFQSCVQFLQYYYQSGCLYRLCALGKRNHLDLTVEGFQSWMWRGLTFLLPFLFFGHFWQLYNAITLFELSRHTECKEWQVVMVDFPSLTTLKSRLDSSIRYILLQKEYLGSSLVCSTGRSDLLIPSGL